MTMDSFHEDLDRTPSEAEILRDRHLETVLDELVSSSPGLDESFSSRLVQERPFAPWEVRRVPAWRVPVGAGALLLASSAGIFLAPLWHLGPGTALAVWGRVLVAAVATPLSTAVSAGPALAEAVSRAADALPAVRSASLLGLGAAALLGGLAMAGLRRLRALNASA